MKQKVALIINSTRSLGRKAKTCVDALELTPSLIIEKYYTKHEKHAVQLAKTAINESCNVIVAVGGDGTCNEIINGLLTVEFDKTIRFGVIPNGTGNDFLKNFAEFAPHSFVNMVVDKAFQEIDVIEVKNPHQTAYSLNIAGIGFDGHVVQVLSTMRKSIRLKGKFAYALAILKTFINYKRPQVSIRSEDFLYEGTLLFMAVCNGKAFGHGLFIHPEAKIDDSLLSVTVLGNVSFFDYVRHLGKLKRAQKINHPEVQYVNCKSILITVQNQNLFSEVDGEYFGTGDLNFKILPKALRYIA